MTSVLVRPAGSLQRVEFCSCILPASLSRWKERKMCLSDVGLIGDIDGSRKRIVAQAGLGRYSGAIHGSRSKKSWRRSPSQISQDEQNEEELVRDLQLFNGSFNLRDMYGGASGGLLMSLSAAELFVLLSCLLIPGVCKVLAQHFVNYHHNILL
jgi:hypothetical protein